MVVGVVALGLAGSLGLAAGTLDLLLRLLGASR